MTEDKEIIISILNDMFKADTEYGCGFYNADEWREAYAKLQKIAGYKENTTVFCDLEDFNDLPDP